MHPMTVSNLESAFAGESQAHMRYLSFADKADKDGFPNIARLFRAISWAEQIHATSHFMVLRGEKGPALTVAGSAFGLGPTAENLSAAIEGEKFEVNEMYPAYKNVAVMQEEKAAVRSLDWAGKAEETHAALYKEAKASVEAGKDYDIGTVSVCARCGHTLTGDAPNRCPICEASKASYRTFD